MIGECSIPLLEAALAGQLPADDEARLTQHLGECEACALAMERLVGEPQWRQAATLLAADEFDDALSGLGSTGDWSEVDFTVEHLEPAEEPGTLGRLGGYDVLEIIGRGGMGVVLKAFDRELKRCVAIKVLAPHLANSALAKKRFAREAQAAAAIVHPHVLAIHQVRAAGPLPFLVMPLVSGESLAQRLERQGSLELLEVLRIGMQAAAGLSAAHDQGLVHRDVKPANILLETGIERAVLTDFGLARAADDAAMTRLGIIAGTPQYMSPEQARGVPLDGRSDLFSLGCVLFEMATGVSPFRADSALATMRRLVEEPPPALGSLNPELPPWFVAIVERLLEKDPANRFGSAREVSELLEGCLAHLQHPAAAALPASLSKAVAAPAPRRRSYRTLGVVTMTAIFGLVLCGAMAMFATDPPDIAGTWSGEEWGKVVLKKTAGGVYTGTYSDTVGKAPGEIALIWSRIERRFNGAWHEGDDRFGDLSLRLVDGEIRGACTSAAKSRVSLAELTWRRDGTLAVTPMATPAESSAPKVWAVAKVPTKGGRWWTKEGRLLPAPPVDSINIDRHIPAMMPPALDPKLAWYVVLFRVPGGVDQSFNREAIRAVDMSPQISLEQQTLKGRSIDDAVALALGLPEDSSSVDLTVEAPVGCWETVSILGRHRASSVDEANSGAEWRLTKRGLRLRVLVEFPRTRSQSRIAVKNAGKVTFTRTWAPDALGGAKSQIEVELPETLDPNDRLEVELQTRPYEKYHIRNIALRPESDDGKGPRTLTIPSDLVPPPVIPKANGQMLRRINVLGGVSALAASPDGSVLAVAAQGGPDSVFLLDVEPGRIRKLNSSDDNEKTIFAALKKDPNESAESEVSALAFSPDGKLLAVGTSLGQVKLYDASSADLVRTFDDVDRKREGDKKLPKFLELRLAHGSVRSLAFSPYGKTLATCGSAIDYVRDHIERYGLDDAAEGLLKTWDVKTGKRLIDFKDVYGNDVFDVGFSPDGSELACVGNGGKARSIHLFDPRSGKLQRSIAAQTGPPARDLSTCLAYSPDGKRLAVGITHFHKAKDQSSGMFAVLHPESGIVEWTKTSPNAISKIAFTPDGTKVATLASESSVLKFWDASTGAERSEMRLGDPGEPVRLTCFAFLPQARMLALGGTNGGGVELRALEPVPAIRP